LIVSKQRIDSSSHFLLDNSESFCLLKASRFADAGVL
jgi:hypothetical protein